MPRFSTDVAISFKLSLLIISLVVSLRSPSIIQFHWSCLRVIVVRGVKFFVEGLVIISIGWPSQTKHCIVKLYSGFPSILKSGRCAIAHFHFCSRFKSFNVVGDLILFPHVRSLTHKIPELRGIVLYTPSLMKIPYLLSNILFKVWWLKSNPQSISKGSPVSKSGMVSSSSNQIQVPVESSSFKSSGSIMDPYLFVDNSLGIKKI